MMEVVVQSRLTSYIVASLLKTLHGNFYCLFARIVVKKFYARSNGNAEGPKQDYTYPMMY